MASLSFQGLTKNFGKTEVVKGFDLEVNDGEFVVLLGASGCGKSTILRMVAGLESISSGRIMMGDKCLNEIDPKDRDLAMVFQSYALYPHMTVYQNIAFALKVQGYSKPEIEEAVEWAADMLQLKELLQRKPKQLSGGQRQRVAMGRAMVRTPKLFLFDEPLSNLDAKLRGKMRQEIKDLHTKLGVTTLYVTHDQVEAMTLADRIVILDKGVVAQIGTPYEVFTQPSSTFVAGFIGSPMMNMFSAKVKQQGEQSYLDIQQQRITLPSQYQGKVSDGQAVLLGVRPNDIYLHPKNLAEGQGLKVKAKLNNIELLGATMLARGELSGRKIIVEAATDYSLQPGDCELYLDSHFAHLFDATTLQSLA
ncbi:ABC transporter ATP-binding protein [Agarivorans sp.]|uniref:ABC transporter ATP-binding protein n=1 Tax=Agarivorans sp. TaxID=1872412 RepID=UPI003D04C58A